MNEDGVEITIGTENYLFSSACTNHYFVSTTPSSRLAVVDLKVPFGKLGGQREVQRRRSPSTITCVNASSTTHAS